jgi:hypothetical protein
LLKVAAAAAPEVRARRLHAHGRLFYDLYYGSERDAPAHVFNPHAHKVTGRSQSYKHGSPIRMSQPHPARQDAFNAHLYQRLSFGRAALSGLMAHYLLLRSYMKEAQSPLHLMTSLF